SGAVALASLALQGAGAPGGQGRRGRAGGGVRGPRPSGDRPVGGAFAGRRTGRLPGRRAGRLPGRGERLPRRTSIVERHRRCAGRPGRTAVGLGAAAAAAGRAGGRGGDPMGEALTVGLLHTVPALAASFDGLLDEQAPGLRRVHVADAWLLQTARREGLT